MSSVWTAGRGAASEPNVAEWIAAISTAGALIAAGVAAFIAWRVHAHDRTAQRADQASRVAAWIEWRDDLPGSPLRIGGTGWGCVLLNSSALPVYDMVIIYWLLDGSHHIHAGTSHVELVAPGEKAIDLPEIVRKEQHRRHRDARPTTRVELRYTDSAGRRWWRGHNGVLIDKGPWTPAPPEPQTDGDTAGDP